MRNFLRILPLAALLAGAASSAQAQVELNFCDQVWGPGAYSQRAQQLVTALLTARNSSQLV
ncbi:hypothetical protein, partial [Rhizobium leguminosarum]|uniref:hypothetical protein n=1 Tax=Rhizobium leguminosarum TaxID=384 RepID=UPI003F96E45F